MYRLYLGTLLLLIPFKIPNYLVLNILIHNNADVLITYKVPMYIRKPFISLFILNISSCLK